MTPHRPAPTSEAEYREYPAINFSSLAAYNISPDHALMKVDHKAYFEYGRQFETMLQDTVKGTDEFKKRFFKSTVSGKMPDELIQWIDKNEDLESKYNLNKDGSRSKTSATRHAFLDEAQANPGKIPVSIQDWDMLNRHTENMLKMQYLDANVEDILAAGEWQVPILWEENGHKKKALIDVLVDLGGEYLPIDIKTTAGFRKFSYDLRDRYFLQAIHYCQGVTMNNGVAMEMPFFVASKEAPYLCQPWTVDFGGVDFKTAAIVEYHQLCDDYQAWRDAGKPPKGWLPLGVVKRFPKI